MFRDALRRLLRAGMGAAAYDVDPLIDERLARQVLADVLPRALRGLLLKPWLGSCQGIPLVGRGARVTNPQRICCGRGFAIEDGAEIQGLSRLGIHFGDNVTIGRQAQIRPSGYYGRDLGVGLTVGDNSNIGALCYLGASGGITIGHHVLMGPSVVVLSEEHCFDDHTLTIKAQGVRRLPTVIEDDVWLGARATILGGTRVGRGSVVAAGAVVREDVPPFSVVAGVPARVVGERRR
ncbi:MAG TPA: DapH/DapD/GlmU-related protein [Candidatus Dormibacteraeota bacterium]|nr:DapH/DapD/GlmU-related protein [Candidatus Dormibacteraeota bacterium]